MTQPNPYAEAARAAKALAISRAVERRLGYGPRVALLLVAMPREQRRLIAVAAGQHEPSSETWRQVIRLVADDTDRFARVTP